MSAEDNNTRISELENILSELTAELTIARFNLGEIPSHSDALCRALDYLQSKDEYTKMRSQGTAYNNIPRLLRPQAI